MSEENLFNDPAEYHTGTPVVEFHQAFGHPVETRPTVPSPELRRLRVLLIAEELQELADASGMKLTIENGRVHVEARVRDTCDLVEVADALGDLRYVVDGANLAYGIPGEAVLMEIHGSNMSKLGEDGKPIYREDGKVLKGPDYTPPNIGTILRHVGWEPADLLSGDYDTHSS